MKRIVLAPVILFLIATGVSAQKIDSALHLLSARFPSEKIYIHYDKEYYVAGETIWLKAYLYNDGKPGELSNNLYLQFSDSKGQVVSTKQFPIMGSVVNGSIDVPDSLPQGNYCIRALTPGMLSYDEAFIYKKNILVFRPGVSAAKEKAPPPDVSIQFFPESGDFIEGVLSVVAFKATDQWGIPLEVNGIIRSDEGSTIASFKTFHDGIGKVQFRPQGGKKYVAEVEIPGITGADKKIIPLPIVKAEGINLHVQDEKGGKKFQLSRSEKGKGQFETVLLVAQINNHIVYENEIAFEDYPSVVGHLVTDSLPSGILHFTVFNKDGAPLAERLSFINNQEYISNAAITTDKVTAAKRAENIFELSFSDSLQRSCSVSITDASGGGFNDNDNIWSRLLLTSDLKGTVYNPAWYFANNNDTSRQAMDNLMLTHGWSRFNWTKILANEFPERKYKDPSLISISGKVMDDKNKESLQNGRLNIYLEAKDSVSQNYEVPVNAAGEFKQDSMLFFGKAKLFYAYLDSKERQRPALAMLNDNALQKMMETLPPGAMNNILAREVNLARVNGEINTRYGYVLSRLDDIKELERITLQSRSVKKPYDAVNEKYTKGVFRTPGKVTLDNINNPASDKSMNVVDYIKNRIQQIEVQGNQFVNRKNFSLGSGQKWAIGVFLNESPSDFFQLRLLRTGDIALVKFFEAGFVGVGSSFPGGALSVYTKEDNNNDLKPDKLNYMEYNGYSISKEFYHPDYSNAEIKHPGVDNRTTLYWNPNVFTDAETRSFKLKFFNNDFSKKFKVVVEGFDAAGKLIHLEKIIGSD